MKNKNKKKIDFYKTKLENKRLTTDDIDMLEETYIFKNETKKKNVKETTFAKEGNEIIKEEN